VAVEAMKRRVKLGDTVRMPGGEVCKITGTMTLQPPTPPKLSVCAQTERGPVWLPEQAVVVIEKATK